ncbi:MAG TPA: DUF4055 domain-containing protein [Planctomycetota bacterium]|nr:DUF4055 domain-containing protein [Planctomycetota bacterium]
MALRRRPPSKPAEPSNAWVGKESVAYQRMAEHWKLPDALLGGTRAMQEAGEVYLPREEGEERKAYQVRLQRSTLHGFYRGTLDQLAARPFGEPVTIRLGRDASQLPELLAPIEADADYSGSSLTQFGRRLLVDGLHRGLVHVLVEMPGDLRGLSVKAERQKGLHPYFCHVSARDLIGWTSRKDKSRSNREELTQIRIRETHAIEVDGVERDVEHVRVWNAPVEALAAVAGRPAVEGQLGTWQLWRRVGDGEDYALVDDGVHTFAGIPLVTVYFNRTAFMEAEPCLADLAELEKAHWQSASDQSNILRYARVPKFAIEGLNEEARGRPTTMGVGQVLKLPPGAKAYWVEPQGNAIAAGRQHLLDLQAEMHSKALQPLMERTGSETATGQEIADKKSTSNLKAWVRSLEAGLLVGLRHAASVVSAKLPEKLAIDIFSDWAPPSLAFEEVRLLKEIRAMGDLSRQTFVSMLKGRLLPEDLDVAKELSAIADEGESLASFGMPPDDEGGSPDGDKERPPREAA